MPFPNFMVRDIAGSLVAVLIFSVVLYAPGYLAGVATNALGFRKMQFAEQSLWAIAFSFCVSPIAGHLIGRAFGLKAACWAVGLTTVAAAGAFIRCASLRTWSRRDKLLTLAVAVGWTALVLLLLIDCQVGRKLYYSVVMADQSYRIAFTDAVVRTGVPPANPLYFAGAPAPMRYYYFWYVLCAAVVKLGHVSARQAFIASSVWAAFGLTATVKLYAKNFFGWSRRTSWIAIGLLLVTGADLLPALGNLFLQPSINGNSEWWSVDQIDAWPDSILWVPHHVASVICCLTAFLLLWQLARTRQPQLVWAGLALASAACSSAFGLSVYVALGFALLVLIWLVGIAVRHQEGWAVWIRYAAVVLALSGLMLVPFLHELLAVSREQGPVQGSSSPAHLLHFSVRPLIDSGLLTSLPAFAKANVAHPWFFDQLIRLVLLLPGLAMELGVYGAVLVFLLFAKRRREFKQSNAARDAAVYLSVAGLLITTFLSSSVITNNDFGYRAVMLPQFFLLLLSADVIGGWRETRGTVPFRATSSRKRVVVSLLVLGVAGTVYWAVLLRAWLPVTAAQASSGFALSPEDAFEARAAFATFNRVAPKSAVVAFRDMDLDFERKDMEVMTPTEFFQRMLVMDTGRQILNAEPKCATHFGGNPSTCVEMKTQTASLYSLPAQSSATAKAYCSRFGVQYLLLTARDPGWHSKEGWPAALPIVAEQPRLKVLQCGL